MDAESLNEILGKSDELRALCIDFFMAFSRFEFALKENGYVRSGGYGGAVADWPAFREKYATTYAPDPAADNLLGAPAKQQVLNGKTLEWKDLDLTRAKTVLGKVILVVKTIRNNLFHGGKHGIDDWEDPARTKFLLSHGVLALDGLAKLAGLVHDYERRY